LIIKFSLDLKKVFLVLTFISALQDLIMREKGQIPLNSENLMGFQKLKFQTLAPKIQVVKEVKKVKFKLFLFDLFLTFTFFSFFFLNKGF